MRRPAALSLGIACVLRGAAARAVPPSLEIPHDFNYVECETSQFAPNGSPERSVGYVQAGPPGPTPTGIMAITQTNSYDLGPNYAGTSDVECFGTGGVAADFGALSAKLETEGHATPEIFPPEAGSGVEPLPSTSYARAHGRARISFDDLGTVESTTLADGTPVTLSFTFALDAIGLVTRPLGPHGAANAEFTVDVSDWLTPAMGPVHLVVTDSTPVVRAFETAVGRQVRVQGGLAAEVIAHAGRDPNGLGMFYPDVEASLDAEHTATLTLEVPPGVTFVSESGHEYAVPEPGRAALLLAGALGLLAVRRFASVP
jgi:hypothetical protein